MVTLISGLPPFYGIGLSPFIITSVSLAFDRRFLYINLIILECFGIFLGFDIAYCISFIATRQACYGGTLLCCVALAY